MRDKNGPDRREDVRVPKAATISGSVDGKITIEGAVVNISEHGMCFFTSQPLEPGLTLKVNGTFRLKDFSEDCKVVWSRKVGTDLYMIGISYRESA